MAYTAKILLGQITKTRGFQGGLSVKLEKRFIENIPLVLESLFVEIDGKAVPFFISERVYGGGDTLDLKFDGYTSPERARELTGCRVFLTTGEEEPNTGAASFLKYNVYLPDATLLGSVNEIIENPGHSLLQVSIPGGRVLLVPFHEDFIVSVDAAKKIIIMDIPEGLTELNVSGR